MPYIFGKLWHLAIIWAIRKAFQCILQGVRILLAKYPRFSPTSENESYVVNHSCIRTLLEQLQPFGTLYCCPFLAPCPRLDHKRAPGEEYLSNIKIMNIKYISFCRFVHTFSNKGFQPTVQLSKSMVSSNSSEPLYNNVFNSNFGTHTKEQNSFANLTFGK